ncbi:hypothetical protein EIP91_004904 [Steccherinum ochraceum]|uniref:Uncharacterized protein n=1 Tax=Steccherinum ochraceum TaxID=92696 RepID=A0A4V2MVW2_9APHY|nr:hypothetical protein EIP91_004904 [Steccherinum ochraceum]
MSNLHAKFAESVVADELARGKLKISSRGRLHRNSARYLVVKITQESLNAITGKPIDMHYDAFPWLIRGNQGLDIAGWPAGVPFQDPSTLRACHIRQLLAGCISKTPNFIYGMERLKTHY